MGIFALAFLLLSSGVTTAERAAYSSVFGVIAIVEARLAWGGIWVSKRGVLVRNPVSTHRIAWEEFEGFSMRRWLIYPDVGFILRRDARPIHVLALSTLGVLGMSGDEDAVPDALDHLEKLIHLVRRSRV
jgi:hypothetical protein